MAVIPVSREQYNPDFDLTKAGSFFARLRRVEQGLPWPLYPKKTRIAFEFEIIDKRYPDCKNKRAAFVCGESIYVDKLTGKSSALVQHLRKMGVSDFTGGFDPECLVGRVFYVTCEVWEGKARVRVAMNVPDDYFKSASQPAAPAATPTEELPELDGDVVPF